MRTIFQLPENLISKIAAGEVIERPAYAVKELIENSLDADADTITVHIEESGLQKITVIDNGIGMSEEDLHESFKSHTTSKLSSEEDLTHINTLGFRGEALASIASISKMTIKSRQASQSAGFSLMLREGEVSGISPIGMPQGTEITVEQLFYPVPGRRKFLKSKRTEFRHIVEILSAVAIAYPEVHLTLTHNKKMVFDLPKTLGQLERIKKLLGGDVFTTLLPLSYEHDGVCISGFVTKPQVAATTSHKQYLFVNNRRITNKIASVAVKEAYGTLLEQRAFPIYLLFIAIPAEMIDVNVHPRKEEVRFVDTQRIYDGVFRAVAQTLAGNNLTFYSESGNGLSLGDAPRSPFATKKGQTESYAGKLLREKRLPWTVTSFPEITGTDVLQVHNLYLVTSTKFGMFFVDQHAAHERILFEELSEEFLNQRKKQPQYRLEKPVFIDLSFSDSSILHEKISLFEQLGFTLEHFKDNAFLIHAVPLFFRDRNIAELISEILAEMIEERNPQKIDHVSHRMIAYLACRAAVKAGDKLTKKQAKELLEKLEKAPNNATCPHGRPTKVLIDIEKLHKMFKRK